MIELNTNPSRRELFWFGGLLGIFLAFVGAILWWKFHAFTAAKVLWVIAPVLTAAFFAIPPLRRPLYLGWIYATYPIGWTVTHVLMGLIYYLLFTPLGLIMRMLGRDGLQRQLEPDRESYWLPHRGPTTKERYFRQF